MANKILQLYKEAPQIKQLINLISKQEGNIYTEGLTASARAVVQASCSSTGTHIVIAPDRETAAYQYYDLTQLLGEEPVFFLPSSYKRGADNGEQDPQNILMRTETLSLLLSARNPNIFIVTYPEAIIERVISSEQLNDNMLKIAVGDRIDLSFTIDVLNEYHFERVDFVFEPGQYAVRGSIIDIFSFSDENPYRIDFFGDEVDSIRSFDLESQLSKEKLSNIVIVPNINDNTRIKEMMPLSQALPERCTVWVDSPSFIIDMMNDSIDKISKANAKRDEENKMSLSSFCKGDEWVSHLKRQTVVTYGTKNELKSSNILKFSISPQPVFHKNFELLEANLLEKIQDAYDIHILSDNAKQLDRLRSIITDRGAGISYREENIALHEGFIDNDLRQCFYTDHQIFERYHKFTLRTDNTRIAQQSISLRELSKLNTGDYVVHADHGIGKFGGLVHTEVNGKPQEAIRLIYRDNDTLLVSIHSLHRISKYKSKDGTPPSVHKLGTGAWQRLKEKTKSKVKDIARELIALYAQRKAEPGFQFSPDSYLQTELEASFIYEDTPDQYKATQALKVDMESDSPMDRLVCGDVGFGKTEVAIRAAFKAVTDNKQVAVLVPTTILAFQHYNTFKERLADFPCNISYVSRLRKPKDVKKALKDLEDGKVDIIIGTHRLVAKDVKFKDLGLLIIDEEQRFGVSVKEKLRAIRVNVDTLTLTATPIPRTLQFSLMGARDLSILNTPPANRQPIVTEVHTFNDDIMREAIEFEIQRNGQVFIINNRIQNIYELEKRINQLLPKVKTVVAHGQMDGTTLENVMLDFISGEYDVLIATTIIESGLDIPNANTIIINNAHQFGLSELHQLRGRVGRSNKKAFCYLLAPPPSVLTEDARRRLRIIEEFSDLGSGFNIAMQDLDIRGAGDVLGGEQSGFISDIGYETYQRILNEALLELKETEYRDVFEEELAQTPKEFVTDFSIETDEEMRFPEEYISNVAERMELYRSLDNIDTDEELAQFRNNLIDRFGEIPEAGERLFTVVKIRRISKSIGIEKIVFKNNLLYMYLVSNKESAFYQSPLFTKLLGWLQGNSVKAKMNEGRDKLYITIKSVKSTNEVYEIVKEMAE